MSQVGSREVIGAPGSKGASVHLSQSLRLPVSFPAASSHFLTPERRFQAAKFTVGQNMVNAPITTAALEPATCIQELPTHPGCNPAAALAVQPTKP